jgi:hypothetical protein
MLGFWRSVSRYEKTFLALFLLSLPFVRPAVQGDGVGYYAYLRSPLIDHNFQFASDYPDPKNEILSIYLDAHFVQNPTTRTGHIPNFYAVGPAILWLPTIAITHAAVLALDRVGFHIAADGHSRAYIVALSFTTALYAFLGLWLAMRLARKYVDERWAFWAALGLWLASSLTLYIYFYPSSSHAHSVFCAALFLWYWDRTRGTRTPKQWLALGLIYGLLVDVYYPNFVYSLAPALEVLVVRASDLRGAKERISEATRDVRSYLLYGVGALLALLPTFITRTIIYGNPLSVGVYGNVPWRWASPMFGQVLFSTNHGIFVCTPILILAVVGILLLWRKKPEIGAPCVAISAAFYLLISLYPWWYGAFSFGNRLFISLTPIFILGLAFAFQCASELWGSARSASWRVVPLVCLLILWNLGLAYQWSVGMFPWRTQVYWDEVLYNQFHEVPRGALHDLRVKFSRTGSSGSN